MEGKKSIIKPKGILEDLFLGVSPAKMLDFLLAYQEFDYSESDIARSANVSLRQVSRSLPILVNSGLIYHTRWSGRSKMYRLNKESKAVKQLHSFVFALSEKKENDLQIYSEHKIESKKSDIESEIPHRVLENNPSQMSQ